MKHIHLSARLAAIIVVAVLVLLPLSVQADEFILPEIKEYKISMTDGELNPIEQQPDEGVFWELPSLLPGQRKDGRLRIHNTCEVGLEVEMQPVLLPYDDETAMLYLMSLRTIIKEGDTVLYDGAYARINDDNGLKIKIDKLPAGESREYSISIQGAFSSGDELADLGGMEPWVFGAKYSYAGARDWSQLMPVLIKIGAIFVGIILVLILIQVFIKKTKKKK